MSFLAFLVQGLPIVGKVVGKAFDAFTSYTNKKMDTELEKVRVNGQVDVSVIEARAKLAAELKEDPTIKWGRRLLIYPTGVWYALITWRSIAMENPTLEPYSWVIKSLPPSLDYIPYAVVAFCLVTAWRK